MGVPQFTTPTLVFTFSEEHLDLTQASEIVVSLRSMRTGKQIDKTGSALEVQEKQVSVDLSQEETGAFADGDIKAKINWLLPNGKRAASEDMFFSISNNIYKKVMPS